MDRRAAKPEQAVEIEKLGYGAVWIGISPAAELNFVGPILEATESLRLATGISNVWSAPADQVADSYHRIEAAYPGRFLLGIGIGHRSTPRNTASPTTRSSSISTPWTRRRSRRAAW